MDTNWILINDYKFPVNVLGPGERVVVWTQGCSIRCKDCMSIHTWDFDKRTKKNIKDFVKILKQFNTREITISGGEPFEQQNLYYFLKELRENNFIDILVYSGYKYSYIKKNFFECLYFIDVLISEPFESGNESDALYKGSNNQKAIIFNKNIYKKYKEFLTNKKNKKLQVFGDLIVGIPYQKDLKRMKYE